MSEHHFIQSSRDCQNAERALAEAEAQRAFREGHHDRAELAELAASAHGGPIRFAMRMRRTEFGGLGFPADAPLNDYLGHLYGEEACFGDDYSTAYLAQFASIAPFVASLH